MRKHHSHAFCHVTFQSSGEGDLTHLVWKKSEEWVYVAPDDRLGVCLGDLLDLHPALCGEQDQGPLLCPVHCDGEVELPLYLLSVLDVHSPHGVPANVHAEDLPCRLFGLPRALHDLDAAGFAAPARSAPGP